MKIAKQGDKFILQYRNNLPNISVSELPEDVSVELVQADFNDSNSLSEFLKTLQKVDILINNAAEVVTDLLPLLDETNIDKMINTNIVAFVKICKAVIPYMSSKRKGNIINISSIAAFKGNRGQSVYAGTKGFMESFSRSLAAEYGARGVRVNCIAPGPIESGSLKDILNYAPEEIKSSILSKRLGKASDVAALAAFLASDESEFINGESVKIDGGFIRGL